MFFSYSFVKSLHKSPHLSQMIIAKFLYVSNFFWKKLLLLEKATFFKKKILFSEKLLTLEKVTLLRKKLLFLEKVTFFGKSYSFLQNLLVAPWCIYPLQRSASISLFYVEKNNYIISYARETLCLVNHKVMSNHRRILQ